MLCSVHSVVCSVRLQCVVCSVYCAVCGVQCVLCRVCHAVFSAGPWNIFTLSLSLETPAYPHEAQHLPAQFVLFHVLPFSF